MIDPNQNQLLNGDCLEVMKDIPSDSIDMILTDPPYGTTTCKWDIVVPLKPMWLELKRIRKNKAVICLFGSEPFSSVLRTSNLDEFKYDWVWNKKRPSNPMLAKKQPLKVHEIVSVFYNSFGLYNPQGVFLTDGKPRGGIKPSKTELGFGKTIKKDYKQTKSGYPKSIITFGTDNSKNVHPTQKPVELIEYLLKTYTEEKNVVLDFTMGSGTTGIACINMGRKFIGIELNKEYFEIAKKRILDAKQNIK